ncbi:hypothetical protein DPM13_12725 [Paracoccus mutanolyticus]|uniref:Solute-binding protein family 3/N-terminal domain-containing protein n=1 Tax=Paracoccus mutanolyticus TaxID=1499308 RepID=A0ABN5M6Q4_9RHOB|nr:hypothetical protein DPM13_12725 [Paracoccus mutanolyticus]
MRAFRVCHRAADPIRPQPVAGSSTCASRVVTGPTISTICLGQDAAGVADLLARLLERGGGHRIGQTQARRRRPDGARQHPRTQRIARDSRPQHGAWQSSPWGFIDAEGEVKGQSTDVHAWHLSATAQLGITEIETVVTEFGALIPGLESHRFDVVAAGLFINPERCKIVAFAVSRVRHGCSALQRLSWRAILMPPNTPSVST